MKPPYIGTAGWNIPARYAQLFPDHGTHLERYGHVLHAVEINSSFYRPHQRKTYERWAASVPQHFRFAVKLPRRITHEARLKDCGSALDRFLAEAEGLGSALGILLVQLPPSLRYEAEIAEKFLTDLIMKSRAAIACEPRHASWFTGEADQLLKRFGIIRVAADPIPAVGADKPGGWDGAVYYRLHGSPKIYYSNYDNAFLARLKERLATHIASGKIVWCIFDNTAEFAALGNALALAQSISID